jgi:hypothetical protein
VRAVDGVRDVILKIPLRRARFKRSMITRCEVEFGLNGGGEESLTEGERGLREDGVFLGYGLASFFMWHFPFCRRIGA